MDSNVNKIVRYVVDKVTAAHGRRESSRVEAHVLVAYPAKRCPRCDNDHIQIHVIPHYLTADR